MLRVCCSDVVKNPLLIERFSIECRKTKTKVITTANENKEICQKEPMRTQSNACNQPQARENARDQIAIGFSFASDWLRGWREFSRPITKHSKAKLMQSRIIFDTQLKIALTTENDFFFSNKNTFTVSNLVCSCRLVGSCTTAYKDSVPVCRVIPLYWKLTLKVFYFVSAFLTTPGVERRLISDQWIANHYRWLVWKLAAMEVSFPRHFAGRQVFCFVYRLYF